jgi:hypothetical protein
MSKELVSESTHDWFITLKLPYTSGKFLGICPQKLSTACLSHASGLSSANVIRPWVHYAAYAWARGQSSRVRMGMATVGSI